MDQCTARLGQLALSALACRLSWPLRASSVPIPAVVDTLLRVVLPWRPCAPSRVAPLLCVLLRVVLRLFVLFHVVLLRVLALCVAFPPLLSPAPPSSGLLQLGRLR